MTDALITLSKMVAKSREGLEVQIDHNTNSESWTISIIDTTVDYESIYYARGVEYDKMINEAFNALSAYIADNNIPY